MKFRAWVGLLVGTALLVFAGCSNTTSTSSSSGSLFLATQGDKELSFGERKMLDTARNLLVKELAIAKSHTEEKIMEELRDIFTT